jgi:hypothetical protein
MSVNARGLMGWIVMLAVFGGVGFYLWHEKTKTAPKPQPEKPVWTLQKYDLGKFYFSENFITEFRAVCESADCTPLLDNIHAGLLGDLNDVKREGLHLIVKQNGVEYHFKVEAMGEGVLRDESTEKSNSQDDSQ